MDLLKKIPIKYTGELHDVRLINFTVDMEEVKKLVPPAIEVRNFGGKAMISMVDVQLKKMRPEFCPRFLHFSYRHVAFRLLVDDSGLHAGKSKGIYFLRSFTDKPHIVLGGSMLTDYQLSLAKIREKDGLVEISSGNGFVSYAVSGTPMQISVGSPELKNTIGSLDRAYAVFNDTRRVTIIQRERWPIQQVECTNFRNTFFKSATLLGAFRVFETIQYKWLPPRNLGEPLL